MQLLHQFGDDEEGAPAADLLRLENVAEDVVAAVQHVLAFGADQVGEHLARTCSETQNTWVENRKLDENTETNQM